MDSESHDSVMDALFKNLADKTVIVVTHNLVGVEKYDEVVVMRDGRVIERGNPTELVVQESSYLNELIRATGGDA